MSTIKEIRLIIFTFLAVIFTGAFTLMLPFATTKPISFIDALYTATSATCVTGLIVKDTPIDFTGFGQVVILFMIQIGGLGYMTIATFMAIMLRKKLSHRDQMILKTSLNYDTFSGVVRFLKNVFKMVLAIEVIGAIILAVRFSMDMPFAKAIWYGIFHSVSLFNNAGFSLFSNSLMDYKFDMIVNFTATTLIIVGGIGYFVILELYYFRKKQLTRISTHTKLTITTTLALIAASLGLFLTLEWENAKSIGNFDVWQKIMTGYFYAINLRTAGANTIDISALSDSTLFLSTIFMVIGGGAGGTAGGIKVTTFAVIVIATIHAIKGHSQASAFKRTIPQTVVTQSLTMLIVASFYILMVTVLLSETQNTAFIKILYEVASAFGTVGVSTGNGGAESLSANFDDFGKFLITVMMIAGRIGVLAFTLVFIGKIEEKRYQYAEGRVII
jgi:trk system potassium uptake protein TrkH